MYRERKYRKNMGRDLEHFLLAIEETDLWIGTSLGFLDETKIMELRKIIKLNRDLLENYISKDPFFRETLEPYVVNEGPCFIKKMSVASFKAGVGPMAGVAGAFAGIAGEYLKALGIPKIIVENGGDIFVSGFDVLLTGIYAGDSPFSDKIALNIILEGKSCGICSSSGTFGHSFSFGNADVVTVIAEDIILSDSLATAYCNKIKKKDDVGPAIEELKNIPEVLGGLIIKEDVLGVFGNIEIEKI